jgi:quercetin dioxygenase-like cupin family protein
VADECHRLLQGDSLLFLADQPHICRNVSAANARLLIVIVTPPEEIRAMQQRHLMIAES